METHTYWLLTTVYPAPDNPWREDEHPADADPYLAETFVEGLFSSPELALAHIYGCIEEATPDLAWAGSARRLVTRLVDDGEPYYYQCRRYTVDWCDHQGGMAHWEAEEG